jgi:hypothetical protein
LPGPLPAGAYYVNVAGYQPSGDAKLQASLIWRHAGSPDETIGSVDSTVAAGSDAGLPGDIHAMVTAAAVPAQCGDYLVLSVKMIAGSSAYDEIDTSLTIP